MKFKFPTTAARLAYSFDLNDIGEFAQDLEDGAIYRVVRGTSGEFAVESETRYEQKYGFVSPEWFATGPFGEGYDAAPAIQAAINYVAASDARDTVRLRAIDYYINSTITVPTGVVIEGPGGPQTGKQYGANIIWHGDADGTIFRLWGREQALRRISIQCDTGFTADRAIDITRTADGDACTGVDLEDVFIRGTDTMNYGVVYGDITGGHDGYPQNTDYMKLTRVYVNGAIEACIYVPNDSGQCKNYKFEMCSFGFAPYGILCNRLGFRAYNTGFSHLSVAAVSNTAPCDTKEFYGCDAEGCARFYEEDGPTGAAQPILVSGGRLDATIGLHADGRYFMIGTPGPFTMDGVLLEAEFGGNFNIRVTQGSRHAKVNTTGVRFPGVAGGINSIITGNQCDWSRIGCNIALESGDSTPVPDQINTSSATTATANATPTAGTTYRLYGGAGTYVLRATIGAREAATGDTAAYVIDAVCAMDDAGVVTLKSQTKTVLYEDQAAWDVALSLATPVVTCTLTGEAAKTITWNSSIQLVQSST